MARRDFPYARVLANATNLGFGRANNQAFRSARGRFILLLNPDTVVLDGAVDRMLDMMEEDPRIGALGCRMLNGDGSTQRWTGGSQPTLVNLASHFLLLHKVLPSSLLPEPLYMEQEHRSDCEVGWLSGACLLLRAEALEGELFDESLFMYCEDLDLCSRLKAKGWKVVYTPRASIVHLDGRSLALQTPEIKVSQMRSLRRVFSRRRGSACLWVYDLVILAGFAMRYAASIVLPVVRAGQGFRESEQRGRRFLGEAWRALVRR
jgi:GT2 family glycosyltransferase